MRYFVKFCFKSKVFKDDRFYEEPDNEEEVKVTQKRQYEDIFCFVLSTRIGEKSDESEGDQGTKCNIHQKELAEEVAKPEKCKVRGPNKGQRIPQCLQEQA